MVAAPGRSCITSRSKSGSTRSKISRGNSMPRGRTRAPTAVRHSRRCISAGNDRPRSRSAVLRRPGAARLRRPPLLIRALHVGSRGWLHHGRERGHAGLSRHGRGKRSSRSPRSPKETHSSSADRRNRVCGKHQQPTNISPSRPEVVQGRYESRSVPMVWSRRGVPTRCADGRHHGRHTCRHHRRHGTPPEFRPQEIG